MILFFGVNLTKNPTAFLDSPFFRTFGRLPSIKIRHHKRGQWQVSCGRRLIFCEQRINIEWNP